MRKLVIAFLCLLVPILGVAQGGLSVGLGDSRYLSQIQSFQTIALNGGSQTLTTLSPSVLIVTGSSASSTINLLSSPTTGQFLFIVNQATVAWTLGGNGPNIDGAATVTTSPGVGRVLFYDGSKWTSCHLTKAQADTFYGGLSATNAWSGANSYTATVTLSNGLNVAFQTWAQSSLPQTLVRTSGTFGEVTGSGGGTLSLWASPVSGDIAWVHNSGTSTLTVSGNGKNIDGLSTISLGGSQGTPFLYTGTQWVAVTISPYQGNAWGSSMTFNSSAVFNARFVRASQTFSTTGNVVVSGGSYIALTGTNGGTLTLPTASLTSGQEFVFEDEGGNAGTNNWIVSGNGNNINGSASKTISTNNGRLVIRWNGTAWFGG